MIVALLGYIITVENLVTSKQQQWWISLKSPIDSGKTFFDISVNTCQIGMGFETHHWEQNQYFVYSNYYYNF